MPLSEEIERKFLIRMPDVARLEKQPEFTCSEIEQIYLSATQGTTHRIRRRTKNGKTVCTETVKRRIDRVSCFEDEKEIDGQTYNELKTKIAEGTSPIVKRRITFRIGSQLYEVDIYPFWKNTAVLECELPSRDTEVAIPECLSLLREVTGDFRFSNAALASSPVPEDSL
ncbi:MAG: hypothetical protein MJ082_04590 [Clostridia bacterium]|nr:hypothetical protein [Clostridia bacterium]